MTLIEFISLITVPVTLLTTATMVFVSVALATKKSRLETAKIIQSKSFGANQFSMAGELWALYFHRLFGDRILAKRQILTIPTYTLVVSGIFFLIWIAYLYIFRNPTHSFSATLPLTFKQAASDFYHKGIIATLFIDIIAIQLTKIAIRTGAKSGYYSARFILIFIANLAAAYLIFSFAIFFFRVEDMMRLYVELAPNDPIPTMPWKPVGNLASSLSLFYPQTIIHFTTQGGFSTYFMPEPLIFYCAVTVQLSLLAITLSYLIATGLERLKNLSIGFVKSVGTPQTNAQSIIVLVILALAFIPIIALSILAALGGK